jgi:hypothetical protein
MTAPLATVKTLHTFCINEGVPPGSRTGPGETDEPGPRPGRLLVDVDRRAGGFTSDDPRVPRGRSRRQNGTGGRSLELDLLDLPVPETLGGRSARDVPQALDAAADAADRVRMARDWSRSRRRPVPQFVPPRAVAEVQSGARSGRYEEGERPEDGGVVDSFGDEAPGEFRVRDGTAMPGEALGDVEAGERPPQAAEPQQAVRLVDRDS